MRPYPLDNANASVIAVTTTATALSALINTASATTHSYRPHIDAVDLTIEDGDIRILYDTNTPTSLKGILLKRGATYRFRRTPFTQMKLISSTGSSVSVSVQLGHSEQGESSSSSHVPYNIELLAGEDLTNDVLKTEQRFSYLNIVAGQATTVVKASAGFLHAIIFNNPAASTNTTNVYDHASGAGTIIATPLATAVVSPVTVLFDCSFSTGLTIITATANGANMTVIYR